MSVGLDQLAQVAQLAWLAWLGLASQLVSVGSALLGLLGFACVARIGLVGSAWLGLSRLALARPDLLSLACPAMLGGSARFGPVRLALNGLGLDASAWLADSPWLASLGLSSLTRLVLAGSALLTWFG